MKTYYVLSKRPTKGLHDKKAWNAVEAIFESDTFTEAQALRTIAYAMKEGDIGASVTFDRLIKANCIKTTTKSQEFHYLATPSSRVMREYESSIMNRDESHACEDSLARYESGIKHFQD